MNINQFAKEVSGMESGEKELPIAQIKEVLRCANDILGGSLYALIKGMEEMQ